MADALSTKDTTWLARFVEDMIRTNAPAALVNASVEELTVTEMLTIADQAAASQQALEYLNQATDKWHFIGDTTDPLAPAFTNSWTNKGAPYEVAAFKKSLDGMVHIRGTITGGTVNQSAFTLPSGYRPGGQRRLAGTGFTGAGFQGIQVTIQTGGNVVIEPHAGSNAEVSIEVKFLP